MPDVTQWLLDAVHDYMPQRAQAWIEDRALIKRLEESYSPDQAAGNTRSAAQQHYARLKDMEFANSPVVDYAVNRIDEQTDATEAALLYERHIPVEELRAVESWLKNAGESYMAEVANGRGQPDLFHDLVETYRHAANDAVPTHKPTETVAYRVEHAYHDKHFPKVSQEQRDAGRATAVTPEQAGQMDLRLGAMQKSNDHGLER